ncbi:MAG: hypothetical protein C4305_02535 [Thermoleophilia bacterium]
MVCPWRSSDPSGSTSPSSRSTSTWWSSPRATRRRRGPAACRTGIVTAVGPDATGIEAGDKVLYPRDAGYDVRLGGIEVKVLKRSDLIARVHD